MTLVARHLSVRARHALENLELGKVWRLLAYAIVAPRELFSDLPRHPNQIVSALAIVSFLCGAPVFMFLQTDLGQRVIAREQHQSVAALRHLTPAQVTYLEHQGASQARAWPARMGILTAIGLVSTILVGALSLYFLAGLSVGPDVTLTDTLAITVFASAVFVLEHLFLIGINAGAESYYLRATAQLLLPGIDVAGASLLWRVAGLVDPFTVWWLCITAVGLRHFYGRSRRAWAVVLIGAYLSIAVIVALVRPEHMGLSLRH